MYRIFNTQDEVDAANASWAAARESAGIHDIKDGRQLNPDITQRWSDGRATTDGKIACPVPDQWADAFGGIEVESVEFPQSLEMI